MLIRLLSTVAVVLVAVGPPQARPAADWAVRIEPAPSPAGPSSSGPQMTTSSRGALLSWIERAGPTATLKFAEWSDGKWSGARVVASGDNWFVNWADVPSVMRLSNGTLVAHWLQKSGPGTYAYDVRLSRSTDEGRTWAHSRRS